MLTDEQKRERNREANRRYREKHREEINTRYAEWVDANREKRRASWRKYGAKRRAKLQAERDAELKRIEDAGADL